MIMSLYQWRSTVISKNKNIDCNFDGSIITISGVTLGEGTGATMSDDEDDMPTDFSMDQAGSDAHDMMGFGLPTESERSLMERVRQELKIELKQVNQL